MKSMGESINNFIALLTKGDFFLIFLIVMMIIIIGVIVYLVKLQSGDAVYYDKDDEEDDEDDEIDEAMMMALKAKEEKKKEVLAEPLKVEKVKYENNETERIDDSIEETKEEELEADDIIENTLEEIEKESDVLSGELVFENPRASSMNIKQSRFNFDEVKPKESEESEDVLLENEKVINEFKNFEDEQEATAIISASELENRLNELRASGEIENHEREIQKYEEEQETKAIISYEELLTRASQNNISYESEEELGGIKVSKVDTSKIETFSEDNDKPYYKEESFLKALKEFRRAL